MPSKKVTKNWKIALVHLSVSLVIVAILGSLFSFVLLPAFGIEAATVLGIWLTVPAVPVFTFFGVWYSAQYVQKRYVIPDFARIVWLSTFYYILFLAVPQLLRVGVIIYAVMTGAINWSEILAVLPSSRLVTQTIGGVLSIIVFYSSSKKLLK